MIQRIVILLVFLYLPFISQSQITNTPPAQQIGVADQVELIYKNDFTVGAVIHSSGFGINYRRGKHLTGYKRLLFEAEGVNISHPKEIKTRNPYFDNSSGFYYGKQYSLIALRGGIGVQRVLYGKSDRKGVEIRLISFIGPTFGFAKPIYLEIIYPSSDPRTLNIVTERYDPAKHTPYNIYGRASYFRGIENTKIYPGVYGKLAFSGEYGEYDDDIKALEVGVSVDAFPKVIPIMAYAKNNQFYVNLYIHFMWGKKWF